MIIPMMIAEKVVTLAVFLTALTVAAITMAHGDLALGLLIILGQVQTHLGHHGAHATSHDAQHLAIHKIY